MRGGCAPSKFGAATAGPKCLCCQCMFPSIPIPNSKPFPPIEKLLKDGYSGDSDHVDLHVSKTANLGMAIL